MRRIPGRTSAAVASALVAVVALGAFLIARDKGQDDQRSAFVVDDFESGAITGWRAVGGGVGGWFVYTDGRKAPDPARSDPNFPFLLPDPPQGRFAAVTDMNGPGTRILYRDVRLDGRFVLYATIFYAGSPPLSSPQTLAHDAPEANQQFRIDLMRPSAPIDSVASGDVLVNVFRTWPDDPVARRPMLVTVDVSRWAGQTVRLRLATTDNRGPLRAGVDDIRFERIGTDDDDRIELLATPEPSSAIDLVLHRLTEGDALAALSARAEKLAGANEFPAPRSWRATGRSCWKRHGALPTGRLGLQTRRTRGSASAR